MRIKKQALINQLQTIINDINSYEGKEMEATLLPSKIYRVCWFSNGFALNIDMQPYRFNEMVLDICDEKPKQGCNDLQLKEKSIHDRFCQLAQEIWNKDQVCVQRVFIDWDGYSSMIKSDMIVNEVRIETKTIWALMTQKI